MSWRISGASPHHAEDRVNTATPAAKILRWPYMSPSEPPVRSSAARKRAYDSTTHCTSVMPTPNDDWIAGKATLTTVPSIKAMLEPRMVAARIHALPDLAGEVQGGA